MSDTNKTIAPAPVKAARASEAPRYKILRTSYINDLIVEEGQEVIYLGTPGSALEPLNEAALEAKANAPVPKESAL